MDQEKVITEKIELMHSSKLSSLLERARNWLKDPYNLALLVLVIFCLAVNVYYFNLTKDQALWWDEAEYMSMAKHWAFDVPFDINPQRPPLFPLLGALFFILGLSDLAIKFVFVLIPTVLTLPAIYLLAKKMYGKKIALISTVMFTSFWTSIFWTARFQPDTLSLLFSLVSVYFFWETFAEGKEKYAYLVGIFAALAILTKVQHILLIGLFVLFAVFNFKGIMAKKKAVFVSALSFTILMSFYFIWSYTQFGTPLGFKQGYYGEAIAGRQIAWYVFNFVYVFLNKYLFVFFPIGLSTFYALFISPDLIYKENKLKADLLTLLAILVILVHFTFYQRSAEDRWFMFMAPFLFMTASKGIVLFYDLFKKYGRAIAVVPVIVLLAVGVYAQLNYSNNLILSKKDSYAPVKEAALWMKENSDPKDIIWSVSTTQAVYYSERKVLNENQMIKNSSMFNEYVRNNNVSLIMWSVFEPVNTDYVIEWAMQKNNNATLVKSYFADTAQKQPILLVFKRDL